MNETSANSIDPRIEAALQEYLETLDRGEAVEREAFLERYPEIADTLRNFIIAEEQLRKLAGDKCSRESAEISTRSFTSRGQETVPPRRQPDAFPKATAGGLQWRFGRYQIIRALGKGAMGAVYLAEDSQLERKVAIKTPHFEDDPTGELVARFYREARAAATLRHANICPVHDVGQIDGKHFISMAYIEGQPLSDLIHSGKAQNERQIVVAVHKLARALQQAHDHEIVHRDLKPANIMVDKQGEPIIMDFGLARKARKEGEASLTQSGAILGSPAYMSPEQIEGEPASVGPASDQYSLGVVLYEMLTGQLPFRGSVMHVLAQIITKGPTPPSELRPGIDPRIEAVCLKMMAKKASERFPSMKAVADKLAAIVKNPAATPSPAEKSPTASRAPASATPVGDEARASQIRKSVKQKVLSESDVTSLEELVRKCLRRHDYDQIIQIIERIPDNRRNESLQTLLEKAREKIDDIAFLICEIDEADRLEDGQTALKKAEELLKIKPGHHRAKEIQEKYSGYGGGGAARIGPSWQFAKPWSEGGWIPWSVLAFGLIAFAGMYGVMVIYLGKTAIVVDIKDPGVEVVVKGATLIVTGPDKQSVKVEPGGQELKIISAGFETTTKSFSLKKGETKTVTVSIVNKEIVARLENEILPIVAPTRKEGEQQAGTAAAKMAESKTERATPSRATSFAADPDRHAAEAVLALGGSVTIRVQDQEQAISTGNPLPSESFQLLKVNLGDRSTLTDAGLEPLRGATHLVDICLNHTRVSDAGFMYFKDLSELEVLCLEVVPVTDRTVSRLAGLTKLRVLDLGVTHVTDAGLAHLDGLVNLEFLNVGETGNAVTDAGLQHIGNLRRLKYLNLNGTQVTNAGLAYLEGLTQLETAGMSRTHVRGSGLVHLRKLVRLKNLWLEHLGVTDGDLAQLRDLTALEMLNLAFNRVSGAGLAHLKALTQLHDLYLDGSPITNSGLEYVKNLPQLRKLHLRETRVTDAGLHYLAAMTDLDELDLTGSGVTAAGVERLRKSLPACWIISSFPAAATAPVKRSSEPDRRAAEAVLALGGSVTVRVNGQEQEILGRNELPAERFELIRIVLRSGDLGDDQLRPLRGVTNLLRVDLNSSANLTNSVLENLLGMSHLQELDASFTKIDDAGLARLRPLKLSNLRHLWLGATRVTDAGIVQLATLPSLQGICLAETRVTDAGMDRLGRMTNLRWITLAGLPITDAGFKQLVNLKEIRDLWLNGTRMTDAGLIYIQQLPNLVRLRLSGTRVTDAGVSRLLLQCKEIHFLDLGDTNITAATLPRLRHLSHLDTLELGGLNIADSDLIHLTALANLEYLILERTRVTDMGLTTLKTLTNLRSLDVSDTRVTQSGADALRKSLPNCKIIVKTL